MAVAVAVPFREVISERAREGSREGSDSGRRGGGGVGGGGGGGGPDFTAKRDPVRRSVGPSVCLAFDQKFLVYFRICLPHGKSWPDREEDWMSLRSILGVRGRR